MAVDTTGTVTGPTHEGEVTLERRGIEPVPATARYGSVLRVFTVWFAPNIVPAAFFLGSLATADFIGLGWWSGLIAIVLGNIIGSLPVGLLAAMGPRVGMAQMPLARAPFGKSIVVPGLVNWASTIGWDAINSVFGAAALTLLIHTPFALSLAIIVLAQGALGILGYEAIHTFEKWMSVVLGVMFLVLTFKIIGVAHLPHTAVTGKSFWGGFILMTTISASFVLAWALYASDYTRYLPAETPPNAVFWRTFLGLVVSAGWIEILGLAAASLITNTATDVSSMRTIRDIMGAGFLGGFALLAVTFGTVAVNALNDYTGSLSLQAAGVRIFRPISAGIVAFAGYFLTLWFHSQNVAGKFENFLLFISYWIAPWAAVVLVDWWRRRGRVDTSRLTDFRLLPSGWQALTALLVGFIASIPFTNTTIGYDIVTAHPGWDKFIGYFPNHIFHGGDIAYFVGFVVAAIVFMVLPRERTEAMAPAQTM